jgi:hypothetical protein
MTITAEYARELIVYNPDTGAMIWRRSKGAAKAGSPAGGPHRSKGYGTVMIDGQRIATHRLAWLIAFGRWPNGEIDHINGKPDDNRLSNLRDVSVQANRQNIRAATARKVSGLLGAHRTAAGRYAAAICVSRKQIHLGMFDTAEEAHAAYVSAKRRLHEGCTI